jgi:diadenosine tetraphosphate (Ap4A) HIT family hydrolase
MLRLAIEHYRATAPNAENVIQRFRHWHVRICPDQCTLFRCIALPEREDAIDDPAALTIEEQDVFWRKIVPAYERVINQLVFPERFRYMWQSASAEKDDRSGWHMIPIYGGQREWSGAYFDDSAALPEHAEQIDLPRSRLMQHRDAIARGL